MSIRQSIHQSIVMSHRILAPVIIAVAIVWLVISCVISVSFVHGTGTVVKLLQQGSGDDVVYCPVTAFRDAAGIEHTIQSSYGSNPPRFPVGSTVSVLYRMQNPDGGMIQDRFILWIMPPLLIVVVMFILAFDYMILLPLLRNKLSQNAA